MEASTRQPAGKREMAMAVAKGTAMATAMAMVQDIDQTLLGSI